MLNRMPVRILMAIILLMPTTILWAEQDTGILAESLVNPGYAEKPAWFANSFLDIREDIAEAADNDKRVLLYFYQDGCPYCQKLLDINLSLKKTEENTRTHYDVIAINIWGDREVTGLSGEETTEKLFAKDLRVMFTPTLLFLNEQGRVVLRVNGYYPPHKFNAALNYAVDNNGSDPSFREYFATHAPAPASGTLHREKTFLPHRAPLNERSKRPLLVLFEQKDCAPCDELHQDILQRPESRELLQQFDVAVVDMWSRQPLVTPDGKTLRTTDWARDLDVMYAPSLVFFDATGREVFRTEAYLKAFHIQSALDYVASDAYQSQPSFQRFISARAVALEAKGIHIDIMK